MLKNLGSIDRIARLAVAVIVAVLWYTGVITGTLAIVLAVVGGILAVTALINFCPIYAIFGIRTCSVPPAK